jgi:hypothetical protein
MKLIAMLSTGKGSWGHVAKLIETGSWDDVILITNDFGKEKFTLAKGEMIVINNRMGIQELRDDIIKKLEGKLNDTEVAVNVISGDGKEHMALISALLKSGVGIKLMALTTEGVKEI